MQKKDIPFIAFLLILVVAAGLIISVFLPNLTSSMVNKILGDSV